MLAAIAAMTVAVAGPSVGTYQAPSVVDSGPYVGIGYGFGTTSVSVDGFGSNSLVGTTDSDNVFIQAGYNFNSFVAVEGRYGYGVENGFDNTSVDTFALYAKPQFPVTSELNVYGLLGYAWSTSYCDTCFDTDFDGLAYGLGASYEVTPKVEVFVDYTNVYQDTVAIGYADVDQDLYSVNVGVTYAW